MSEWHPTWALIGVDMASPDEEGRATKAARIAMLNDMIVRGGVTLPRWRIEDDVPGEPATIPVARVVRRHLRLVP